MSAPGTAEEEHEDGTASARRPTQLGDEASLDGFVSENDAALV